MLNFEDLSDMAWAIGISLCDVDSQVDMELFHNLNRNYIFSTKMENRWKRLQSFGLIKIQPFDPITDGWYWHLTPLGVSVVKEFCKTDPAYRIQKATEIRKKLGMESYK